MATTKRSTRGRATATRAKSTAKTKATTKATSSGAKKRSAPRVAKGKGTPKTKLAAKPKKSAVSAKHKPPIRTTAPQGKTAKPAVAREGSEIAAQKAKFQRERNQLEKNLTEAVREIGLLRLHEIRAVQFERQVAERDATISRLQAQLAELERRPAEPVYVHEVQQTLALGGSVHALERAAAELVEFEDEPLSEDADVGADED